MAYIIALAVMAPVCFAAGAWCAIKGVQLGLRWQIAAQRGTPPQMSNPVRDAATAHAEKKAGQEAQSLLDEYLNGGRDEQLKQGMR